MHVSLLTLARKLLDVAIFTKHLWYMKYHAMHIRCNTNALVALYLISKFHKVPNPFLCLHGEHNINRKMQFHIQQLLMIPIVTCSWKASTSAGDGFQLAMTLYRATKLYALGKTFFSKKMTTILHIVTTCIFSQKKCTYIPQVDNLTTNTLR